MIIRINVSLCWHCQGLKASFVKINLIICLTIRLSFKITDVIILVLMAPRFSMQYEIGQERSEKSQNQIDRTEKYQVFCG